MFGQHQCRRIVALLWDYAADSLPERDAARVAQHLAGCPACQQQAEGYRRAVELMHCYRRQEVPPSTATWHALRSRLEVGDAAGRRAPFRRMTALAAWGSAAAALLLVALILERGSMPGGAPKGMPPVKIIRPALPISGGTMASVRPVAPTPVTTAVETGAPTDEKAARPEPEHGPTRPKVRIAPPSPPRKSSAPKTAGSPTAKPLTSTNHLPVDGGRPASRATRRDFVLEPALSTTQGVERQYVIGNISPRSASDTHPGGGEELMPW